MTSFYFIGFFQGTVIIEHKWQGFEMHPLPWRKLLANKKHRPQLQSNMNWWMSNFWLRFLKFLFHDVQLGNTLHAREVWRGNCDIVMFSWREDQVEGSTYVECPKSQQQIPPVSKSRHYIWIVSNLDALWINFLQMSLHLAKLKGLESFWLLNWDTSQQHKSLHCITGFITKDTWDGAK